MLRRFLCTWLLGLKLRILRKHISSSHPGAENTSLAVPKKDGMWINYILINLISRTAWSGWWGWPNQKKIGMNGTWNLTPKTFKRAIRCYHTRFCDLNDPKFLLSVQCFICLLLGADLRFPSNAPTSTRPFVPKLKRRSILPPPVATALQRYAGEAIHILLDSILRHLLLRNDHLCNSFEMVPEMGRWVYGSVSVTKSLGIAIAP